MKTIREKIIERIISQLEGITTANGYHHEIGPGHVYRQESVVDNGDIPAASVWELSEKRERNSYGGTVRILTIKVEAIVQVNEDQLPATISNELLGDIETALIMGNTTLDELVDDIQDVAAEITHLQPEKNAGASIDFDIKYTTEWGDPYTPSQ